MQLFPKKSHSESANNTQNMLWGDKTPKKGKTCEAVRAGTLIINKYHKMRILSKFVFVTVVSVLSFSSCISSSKTTSVTTVDVTHTGVLQKPVIVDLNVESTKIKGTASGSATNVQAVKNEAINNAISARNADILVEPNFTITSRQNNVTVEVSGYPAKYTNSRTVSESDSIWLRHANAIYMAKGYDAIERQSVTS